MHKGETLCLFAALGFGFLGTAVTSFLPAPLAHSITREGGIVETLTVGLWFGAALLLLVSACKARRRFWGRVWFAILPLALGLRELDFHKRFSTDSILKANYWLGKVDVPADEKIIVTAIVLLILFCIAVTVRFHARNFHRDLRARRAPAWMILMAVCLLIAAKILLDGINANLSSWFNIGFPTSIARVAPTWEEWAELTAALLVFNATALYLARPAVARQ